MSLARANLTQLILIENKINSIKYIIILHIIEIIKLITQQVNQNVLFPSFVHNQSAFL